MSTTLERQAPSRSRQVRSRWAIPRAIAAAAAIVALLVFVPVVIAQLISRVPVDLSVLTPGGLAAGDQGALLVLVLVALAWLSWGALALSVAVEVLASMRRVPAPRIPGLAMPQRLAGGLVAAVLMGTTPVAAAPAGATSSDLASTVAGLAWTAGDDDLVDQLEGWQPRSGQGSAQATSPTPSVRSESVIHPTVVTQRHDTLWLLAEQYLGEGERYVEIVRLNQGVEQPDGRTLAAEGRLYPGWTLRLPADADTSAHRPDRHVVERGDSLWRIAEDLLGSGARYDEIFSENVGDRQSDGRRLTDPELVLPGWVLTVPDDDQPEPPARRAGTASEEQPQILTGEERDADRATPETSTGIERDGVVLGELDRSGAIDAGESRGVGGTSTAPETVTDHVTDLNRAEALAAPNPQPQGTRVPPTAAPTQSESKAQAGTQTQSDSGTPTVAEPQKKEDSPKEGNEPDPAEAAAVDDSVDGAGFGLPSGGVLAGLLLAGLGAELVRRRRQFLKWRRPGEYVRRPSTGARECEKTILQAGDRAEPQVLLAALAALAAHGTPEQRPRARVIELGPESVVIHVEQEIAGDASSPFVATSPLTLTASVPDLLRLSPPDDWPSEIGRSVVTVGTLGESTILIDLETVGTLRISGDDELTAPVLRAVAAEVGLEPRLRSTTRTVCLEEPIIAGAVEAGDLIVDSDVGRVGRAVATAIRRAERHGAAGRASGAPSDSDGVLVGAEVASAGAEASGTRVIEEPRDRSAAPGHVAAGDVDPAVLAPPGRSREQLALGGEDPEWTDPFEIVVADRSLGVEVVGGSGVGLITISAAVPGMVLAIRDDGDAVLLPDAISVRPVGLSERSTSELVEVFAATDLRHEWLDLATLPVLDHEPALESGSGSELTLAPESDPGPTDVPQAREQCDPATSGQPSTGEDDDSATELVARPIAVAVDLAEGATATVERVGLAPRLLLLGNVEVENAYGKAEPARIGRLAETAAFVLLNPDARPSELLAALWPGRHANPQSCRQMMSRTRTWLGRTDEGDPYFMALSETGGRLRLRPEVGSDWSEFQQLAAAGLADPDDVEKLTAALRLVRGRPFGSLWRRELAWADIDTTNMISAIIDVAHELALRHEAAGRLDLARDAINRALRTDAESDALDEVMARIRRKAEELQR